MSIHKVTIVLKFNDEQKAHQLNVLSSFGLQKRPLLEDISIDYPQLDFYMCSYRETCTSYGYHDVNTTPAFAAFVDGKKVEVVHPVRWTDEQYLKDFAAKYAATSSTSQPSSQTPEAITERENTSGRDPNVFYSTTIYN